jgi:hypothetical protein
MAKCVKLYRQNYNYLLFFKKDLRRLIKLLQTYCNNPTIVIDGLLIENLDQIDLLSSPLVAEMTVIAAPISTDTATGVYPALQLRINRQRARLYVRADEKKDFRELIDRIDKMFTGSVSETRTTMGMLAHSMTLGSLGSVIPASFLALFTNSFVALSGEYKSHNILFWIFLYLWIGLGAGAIWLIWNRIASRIAPSCVFALDDNQARVAWRRRKFLDILGVVIGFSIMVCEMVLIYSI